MTADPNFLEYLARVAVRAQNYDNDVTLVPLPWRDEKASFPRANPSHRPIFALLRCDGHVMPHPPITRALDIALLALQSQGYEVRFMYTTQFETSCLPNQVIDWHPPSHAEGVETLVRISFPRHRISHLTIVKFKILGADGAQGVRDAIDASGEPPVERLSKWYYEQNNGSLSTLDFWGLCEKRRLYQTWYQNYWNSTKDNTSQNRPVDGVIMPVAPTTAVQDDKFVYFGLSSVYSSTHFLVPKKAMSRLQRDH